MGRTLPAVSRRGVKAAVVNGARRDTSLVQHRHTIHTRVRSIDVPECDLCRQNMEQRDLCNIVNHTYQHIKLTVLLILKTDFFSKDITQI